jgi:hypothetical protein
MAIVSFTGTDSVNVVLSHKSIPFECNEADDIGQIGDYYDQPECYKGVDQDFGFDG